MADNTKPSYYVTTPIYYVNAAPHLGTAYCTILADVQARFRRAQGYDVKFLTGLDEHGEKVAQSAAAHDMTPQQWCDSLAPTFTDLWKTLEITNDDFIRTTQPRQTKAVQHLWEVLKDKGYIYKGSYDGWYCVPEETYFTETQVAHSDEANHTEGQHLCPDCGRPLERVQEESWFFKLSEFAEPLLALYREHPEFVEPEIRRNEVVSFVEGGLKDLSISRTSFDWGIPLPFDTKHVTYVWFDALINYLTAVGYGADGDEAAAELARRWPAQAHIVGKDIIRFHCVIWPAMLMAAGLPVPERVFVHGFLMVRNEETGAGEKMSKSRGNAIAPAEVIDMLGVEGYRYYFMTDVTPGTDGSISFSRMEQVYNTDLANSWGNLVSRSLNMSAKFFDGCTPGMPEHWAGIASPLHDVADGLYERYANKMADFSYGEAAGEVMALVHAANHYIEDSEPWALAKDPAKASELALVIGSLIESIRICAHLLAPFMPETSAEVLRRISCEGEEPCDDLAAACAWGQFPQGRPVTKGEALFPRIDVAK
jgi:methionyl-tRNA synthetase